MPKDVLPEQDILFSAGIHPWYVDYQNRDDYKLWLTEIASLPRCIMIGEAGLDSKCDTPEALQNEIFEWQAYLSMKINKPLVIHSVGRFNEIFTLSNKLGNHPVWLLHGYNSSEQMTKQLLGRNFLFSFGASVLKPGKNLKAVLTSIPSDRLFLETDDSGVNISEIYAAAASLLDIDMETLKLNIYNNFNRYINVGKLA